MAKSEKKDVVLIGAGVLSTTFGSMLKASSLNGTSTYMNV